MSSKKSDETNNSHLNTKSGAFEVKISVRSVDPAKEIPHRIREF